MNVRINYKFENYQKEICYCITGYPRGIDSFLV